MYICAECTESVDRYEIEFYNGLPVHPSCKISAMIADGCTKEEAVNELIHIGWERDEAEFLLSNFNF